MTEFKTAMGKTVRLQRVDESGHFGVEVEGIAATQFVALRATDAVPFAQAVLDAAGVDAVILTDLPERDEDGELVGEEQGRAGTVENRWFWAKAEVALARWYEQEQNRPDPQVEKLAGLLRDLDEKSSLDANGTTWAKALIEAGVTVP